MICVGIDVAKDKHDCFIMNSEGVVLVGVFTVENSRDGFETLWKRIQSSLTPKDSVTDKVKAGLEAAGHYSYNIPGFLLDKQCH